MAVPKQKHSKGRTRRGRSHKKLAVTKTIKCSHCGKPTLPHRVCLNCGFYKDNEVIDVLEKLAKPKKRKK